MEIIVKESKAVELKLSKEELKHRYDIADSIAAAYIEAGTFDASKFESNEYRKKFMFAIVLNTEGEDGKKLVESFKGESTKDGIPLTNDNAIKKAQHITNMVINKITNKTESLKVKVSFK
jgi:hypothetical protein